MHSTISYYISNKGLFEGCDKKEILAVPGGLRLLPV